MISYAIRHDHLRDITRGYHYRRNYVCHIVFAAFGDFERYAMIATIRFESTQSHDGTNLHYGYAFSHHTVQRHLRPRYAMAETVALNECMSGG